MECGNFDFAIIPMRTLILTLRKMTATHIYQCAHWWKFINHNLECTNSDYNQMTMLTLSITLRKKDNMQKITMRALIFIIQSQFGMQQWCFFETVVGRIDIHIASNAMIWIISMCALINRTQSPFEMRQWG